MQRKRINFKEDSEGDFGFSSQNSTQHRLIQEKKQIEELYEASKRMKAFLEISDDQSFERIEKIMIDHCGRTLNFDISPKNVMEILDKRIERMLKNRRYKKNWSQEDTKILLWTFCKYAYRKQIHSIDEVKYEDWKNISNLIPGSNQDSCMFKVLNLKKVKLSEKKWTELEENLLSELSKKSKKKNWRVISQELFKANTQQHKVFRNAKQCKEHWICFLNPDLKKGPWEPEEDKNLMEYVFVNNGLKKWAQIAKISRGRTQNALKNRFTLMIQRLRKQNPSVASEIDLVEIFLKQLQNGDSYSIQRRSHAQQNRAVTRNQSQMLVREEEIDEEYQPQIIESNQGLVEEIPNIAEVPISGKPQQNSLNYYQFYFPTMPNYLWIFPNQQN